MSAKTTGNWWVQNKIFIADGVTPAVTDLWVVSKRWVCLWDSRKVSVILELLLLGILLGLRRVLFHEGHKGRRQRRWRFNINPAK